MVRVRRGALYLADLSPRRGSEPGKVRPVLVIQTDLLNQIGVLTEECVDTLEDRVEMDAQSAQFQVGEAELGVESAAHKRIQD